MGALSVRDAAKVEVKIILRKFVVFPQHCFKSFHPSTTMSASLLRRAVLRSRRGLRQVHVEKRLEELGITLPEVRSDPHANLVDLQPATLTNHAFLFRYPIPQVATFLPHKPGILSSPLDTCPPTRKLVPCTTVRSARSSRRNRHKASPEIWPLV